MKENKSFTDILARPGIALKLKALLLPALRTSYQQGIDYSLLPSTKGYFFANNSSEENEEGNSLGLIGKLNYSLNKISEKLSGYSVKDKSKVVSEINKKTIFSERIKSEAGVLGKQSPGAVVNSPKIVDNKIQEPPGNSLMALSNKLNELLRSNKDQKEVGSIFNKNNISYINDEQKKLSLSTLKTNNVFNKVNYSTIANSGYQSNVLSTSNSSLSNSTASRLAINTVVQKQETILNLRDYISGLSALNQKKEPLVKNSFTGISERINAKPRTHQNYITQNFGDIIIQPTSMDMSVQQVRHKLEDVLRQVKDSLY